MKSAIRHSRAIAGLFLAVSPGFSPASPTQGSGLQITVGQTVEITRSHNRCWFPTVHRFRSGELLITMSMCPDEVNSEGIFSAYCISRDGGTTWSKRYTMGAEASDCWSEEPDADDAIWQFCTYPEWVREGDVLEYLADLTKFSHGGRHISEDRDVLVTLAQPAHVTDNYLFDYKFGDPWPTSVPLADTRFKTQLDARSYGNIIKGAQGDLLCSAYILTAADATRRAEDPTHRRFYRAILLRSTDGGKHWVEYATIAAVPPGRRPAWMGDEGCTEGSLSLLPDGRLYAVYRTSGKGGMIGNSWSADGGRTWTSPAWIGFSGVAPRIHRLHNGMMVLATGRPGPVALRVNSDGLGKEWSGPSVLYSEMSTRYCDTVEVSPGKLLVVYDSVPYGWYEIPYADRAARNRIMGTFVEVANP